MLPCRWCQFEYCLKAEVRCRVRTKFGAAWAWRCGATLPDAPNVRAIVAHAVLVLVLCLACPTLRHLLTHTIQHVALTHVLPLEFWSATSWWTGCSHDHLQATPDKAYELIAMCRQTMHFFKHCVTRVQPPARELPLHIQRRLTSAAIDPFRRPHPCVALPWSHSHPLRTCGRQLCHILSYVIWNWLSPGFGHPVPYDPQCQILGIQVVDMPHPGYSQLGSRKIILRDCQGCETYCNNNMQRVIVVPKSMFVPLKCTTG